jgi:hypothetical protein
MKKIIAIISLSFLALLLLPLATATNYINPTYDRFDFRNGAYLTFTATTATYESGVISGNYVNFTNLIFNSGLPANLSISSPNNIVLTGASNSSINYTVPAGTSTLKLSSAPDSVTINGTATTTAWTYSLGILTILTTGNDAVVVNLAPPHVTDIGDTIGDPSGSGGGNNPTITPSPTPNTDIGNTPTPIPSATPIIDIKHLTPQSSMYIVVIALVIILVFIGVFGSKLNENQKLKQKMQEKNWKSPL